MFRPVAVLSPLAFLLVLACDKTIARPEASSNNEQAGTWVDLASGDVQMDASRIKPLGANAYEVIVRRPGLGRQLNYSNQQVRCDSLASRLVEYDSTNANELKVLDDWQKPVAGGALERIIGTICEHARKSGM